MAKLKIVKRDGRKENFDADKIIRAITQAFEFIDDEVTPYAQSKAKEIANYIEKNIKSNTCVEEIQDMIEEKLCASRRKDVAAAYIRYRYKKSLARNQYTDLMEAVEEKLMATNVQNQNANVDECSFGGRMGEVNRLVMKKFALENCMSDMARKNHENNEIYIHDLDSYAAGMHNCLSIPFDDLLAKGFSTRQTDVRPANSINTAFQLVAVLFQLQSLQQFGGVSATHLDWTMVPYVRKSFNKHYQDGKKYLTAIDGTFVDYLPDTPISEYIDSTATTYAMDMTEKELKQAVEGMYHNLNTLQSRSGNQLPFTSINYGTCTLPEGRMVIKALLEGSINGVGKLHRTPIFPCGIFQCMKGVNRKPEDPNYDLFRLALESTSKRLYPNYANVDWSNNAGYDKNDPRTYFSTMGALAGSEHLYVRINDGEPIDVSIKDLFDMIDNNELIHGRPSQLHFPSERLSIPGKTKYIQDHSQETCEPRGGVYRITYIPEDVSYIGSSANVQQRWREHKVSIRCSGGVDGSLCFSDTNLDNYIFEIIEYCDNYKELEEEYILSEPNVNLRGTSKRYYKVTHRNTGFVYERPTFKFKTKVPQKLINLSDMNIKVYDINGKWTKIRHIFKNDKSNTPLMMDIRYKENGKVYSISCTEDHPLWTGDKFTNASDLIVGDSIYRADGLELTIVHIDWYAQPTDSYDIGTETGTFIGSDIQMHNCRTANGADINAEDGQNPQLKDGRGNICPVTIIMPTLAMQAKEQADAIKSPSKTEDIFIGILGGKLIEAKDMLIDRYEWICSQSSDSAKFMYENHTMFGYDGKDIRSALKHGTLAIGQLGLAETLQILIGKDQTTDEGMKLAKRIESLFNQSCAEFKKKYKLNFGVYYTPAENLCYTAMKKFQDKYGVIEKVSDKDYFTNSIHVPVYDNVSVFDKIDIESQLTGYSNAGCITYVELDTSAQKNIDALEQIVNYAMDKDIPYFAINVPNDTCLDCGFTGEFNDHCPACGSENFIQLRRVTGYLTGNYKTAFNKGKQDETEDRVKHIGVME